MHRFRARFRRDTSRRDVAPHLPTPQLVPDTEQAQFSPETPLSTPSFPDGVKLLHDCSDATVDICFVHGLTGDRVSTWAPNGQSNVTPWPKTLLPPRLPKARILTYGYDAYVVRKSVASSNRLIDHAANLLTDLSTDRAQCSASTRPIIFVAHSLGGLVCKRALLFSRNNPESHLRDIFDCTKGIIFMGTPHKGAWMADWAKVPVSALGVVKYINKSLLQVLETDNQLLESIQNDFWSMIRELREGGRRIEVTCFFEELPLPGVGKVVSKESATLEGYASVSIHANHRDMVRFNNAEDNGFLRLLGELTRWESQNNNNTNGAQYNADAIYQIENYNSTSPSGDPPSDIKKKLAEERRLCLRTLSFLNIDARQQDIAGAHPTTCDWFFQTDEFRQWHDRTDSETYNGVLWVKGNPGAGKSTLMKHILGYCQRVFEGYTIASYFFNARGDAFEKTPLGMLRSLILQLIEKEPSAYDRFVLIFRKKSEIHQGAWKWRESELKEFLLSEIQQHLANPLILFVDALDECSESHVRDVVGFLEELSVNASNAKATLNICLSSRHYPHISMKRYRELVIDKRAEHNRDIATYVRDKLTKRDEDIEREVLRKASGVFMWVVLVVTMLNTAYDRGRVEAMHQTLREVPRDLDTLFWMLLSQENPDRHETILMLQWVLFARRLLKPEELYYAMLAGTVPETLGAWDPSEITRDDIRRRITDSSRGLIEVRKGDTEITHDDIRRRIYITDSSRRPIKVPEGDRETVQFIHESVNDFLLRNRRLQNLDAALKSNPVGASHDRLKDCCMSYIKMLPLAKDRAEAKSFGSNHPFLEYASMYVFDHVEVAEAGHVGQAEFLQALQEADGDWERVRLFHNSFEKKPGSRCARGVDLLYMAAVHGYNSLVQVLLEKNADVNAQGGYYGMVLQAAARQGNKEIVEILLQKGADVNAQGGRYRTALQAAAYQGNKETVEILLQKGADVNSQGGVYGTALCAAAHRLNKEIVAMLLEKGADVNAQGGSYRTALYAAADRGNKEIVAMLLEKGADVNTLCGPEGTALHAAAHVGNKEIVAMLLEKGADVNEQDGCDRTALYAAANRGYSEILTMLLEKGVDFNEQGDSYRQALDSAVIHGHKESLKILLEKGAGIDLQGDFYPWALNWAASDGFKEITIILLEKGANVNAHDYHNGTALQAAAFAGREEMVTMLLEKGANVNAQGGSKGTALQAAARQGHEEIVAILLDKGADISTLDWEETVSNLSEEETVASPVDKITFSATLQVVVLIFMIFLWFNW